jgi:hypothetical protein
MPAYGWHSHQQSVAAKTRPTPFPKWALSF